MVSKLGRAVLFGFTGMVILGAAGSFALSGCGTTNTETCVGGVKINGKCEGKCDPSKCLANNTCVGNRCELLCTKNADCIEGTQACVPVTNDAMQAVSTCQYTLKSENIGAACPNGNECDAFTACPDGSACTPGAPTAACPDSQCRPLHCIGAGVGDANAYCSNLDCADDKACAPGMYCTVIRLTQNICGTKKGTDMPCIDPSTFHDDGATYQEGPISLLQNACRKRGACAPCQNDDDCALEPDQSCIELGTESVCAVGCNTSKDCEDDHTCASGFCIPKTQYCVGTGQFCEPCNTDLDCAAGGPTVACIGATGDQKACFDTTAKSCTTDANCPVSPSGKHGTCLDEKEQLTPSDAGYHTCYLPFNAGTNKFKCF